ncbi:mycosin-3 [Actinorhabdospora filicis]|uniref:Mycosin-3 n=1 Tax=Actinorhabdospora filicis TaxID=1785913 RepID=A0A9W6W6Q4_9ACTN|nr:type VII secretion-associated serine protease mycosin [Actinorhabdospora filicis]GLZ81802.1 mycosin-3 [Actinorhabdospora filicis]
MPLLKRLAVRAAAALLVLAPGVLIGPSAAFAACPGVEGSLDPGPEPVQQTRLGLKRAFALATGAGVNVAVIDSGVAAHPVFGGKRVEGVDLVDKSRPGGGQGADCDLPSHGTGVAGIIGAQYAPSKSTYYGVAPAANLFSVRVWGEKKPSPDPGAADWLAEGVEWAVTNKMNVINMSITTTLDSPRLKEAVKRASEADIVVVVASGNSGDQQGKPEYPAAWAGEIDGLIAVAGVDAVTGERVSSSSSGPWVGVAAPGDNIVIPASTGEKFNLDKGTSFAAPFVAGTAALLRERFPDLSAKQIVRRIEETANHPAARRDDLVGYGEVNPYAALTADLPAEVTSQAAEPAAPPVLTADEYTRTRQWALAAVAIAAVLVALLMAGRFSVPRGNRRGWRGE